MSGATDSASQHAAAARTGAETRKRFTAAGRAWARDWRERNRAHFDAMEDAGCFAPERFA